ncbi:WAP four-disulfide core domain protein 2-like [Chiloscyllium punctatum]|uniref:WAP four-disulfide core domain protein 2-like n=1 Tax=Chiloscyllium punctatum TaxID=137246 RepID=UPI003B640AB0
MIIDPSGLMVMCLVPTVKPGSCPAKPTRGGLCAELCTGDSDCVGNKKCCSNGCGHVCVSPRKVIDPSGLMVMCLVPTVKPGSCPAKPTRGGLCAELCTGDSDCVGNKKCCSNGCGHVCVSPRKVPTVKPGSCPAKPTRVGHCAELCRGDSDCEGNKKCCSNGCGHVCVSPRKGKILPLTRFTLPADSGKQLN